MTQDSGCFARLRLLVAVALGGPPDLDLYPESNSISNSAGLWEHQLGPGAALKVKQGLVRDVRRSLLWHAVFC